MNTPLQRVQGLGASHSGTGHFWRQRVTAVALVPLSLWFLYVAIGHGSLYSRVTSHSAGDY